MRSPLFQGVLQLCLSYSHHLRHSNGKLSKFWMPYVNIHVVCWPDRGATGIDKSDYGQKLINAPLLSQRNYPMVLREVPLCVSLGNVPSFQGAPSRI